MSKEKSPAFQFYPRDLISDINWIMMSYPEKGMYWQLVSICWLEGSIPSDLGALAKILNVSVQDIETAWKSIGKCFKCTPNKPEKLLHPRLELERQKQKQHRENSALGGFRSAHKRKHKKDLTLQQCTTVSLPSECQVTVNSSSSTSSSTATALLTPIVPLQGSKCELGKMCNGKHDECCKAFDQFWEAYPRHDPPRKQTRLKWCVQFKYGLDIEEMLTWITEAKNRWTVKKFIPQPTTWLNQRRWEGDLPPEPMELKSVVSEDQESDYDESLPNGYIGDLKP